MNVLKKKKSKPGAASSIHPAGQEATAAVGDTLLSIAFPAGMGLSTCTDLDPTMFSSTF